jgi:hypothetical protein
MGSLVGIRVSSPAAHSLRAVRVVRRIAQSPPRPQPPPNSRGQEQAPQIQFPANARTISAVLRTAA